MKRMINSAVTVLLLIFLLCAVAFAADSPSIAIDCSHGNQYCTQPCSNFQAACRQYQIPITQLDAITYDTLAPHTLLILSLPRGNNARAYTETELAALQQYAASGGNLLITAASDRFDPADISCSAAQLTNDVLSAIGAHSYLKAGIIVDLEQCTGKTFQIQLTDSTILNTSHPLLDGAWYSLPVSGNSGGYFLDDASPVLIRTDAGSDVTTLVRGGATTWATQYQACFTSSDYRPDDQCDPVVAGKGDVNLITYETLPGGGWVVTCGNLFFADNVMDCRNENLNFLVPRRLLYQLNPDAAQSISSLSALPEGADALICGTITAVNVQAGTIYVQDATGGMQLKPIGGNWIPGLQVVLCGGIHHTASQTEFLLEDNGWMDCIGSDVSALTPRQVGLSALTPEIHAGLLLQVDGIIRQLVSDANGNTRITLGDSSGCEVTVLLPDTSTAQLPFSVGQAVTITGVGSFTDRGQFCLLSHSLEDVTVWQDPSQIFQDLPADSWFYSGVQYVYHHNLMIGTSSTHFSPQQTLTRSQLVTTLYRMEGSPSVGNGTPFSDIGAGLWYTNAITWASQQNIVNGFPNGTFGPDINITREQIATILYRYAAYKGYDTTIGAPVFPDSHAVGAYAQSAMQWCTSRQLLYGANGLLQPTALATRAQLATILMRYGQNIADT